MANVELLTPEEIRNLISQNDELKTFFTQIVWLRKVAIKDGKVASVQETVINWDNVSGAILILKAKNETDTMVVGYLKENFNLKQDIYVAALMLAGLSEGEARGRISMPRFD